MGGGSRLWAVNVIKDLALCPSLEGELSLYDLDRSSAAANVERAAIIFGRPEARTKFRVTVASSLADSLAGSDFVMISIQPGPIGMMASDLDVPLRYGIFQTVGDTTGPGGLVRALRTVPIFSAFAEAVMANCPRAWVFNYTNPMAAATAALHAAAPGIKAFGCCHEVLGIRKFLAELMRERFDLDAVPDPDEIELEVSGVNHFTFALHGSFRGEDLFPSLRAHMAQEGFFADRGAIARERKAKGEYFVSDKRIVFDFLRRFGALGAAGDRHLAEFVPWYLKSEEEIHRWGMILTPSSYRLARLKTPPPGEDESLRTLAPTGEMAVERILALLGKRDMKASVNLPNSGQAAGLPEGTVVETFARLGGDGVFPTAAGRFPQALSLLVCRIADIQAMTLRAADERDKDLAFQALLLDPLVAIPTDRAYSMFTEMLENTKEALPGWKL
ncbi:MAG: alpha-galactosidase [Spirochaetales bacterium]|nr:alpha-galactosidase [Spirochaetales bacterium]